MSNNKDDSSSQFSSPSTPLVQSSSSGTQGSQSNRALSEATARTSTPLIEPESFVGPNVQNSASSSQQKQVTFSSSTSAPSGSLKAGVTFYENSDSDDPNSKSKTKKKKLKNRSKQQQQQYSTSYSGEGIHGRQINRANELEDSDQNDDKMPLLTSFKDKIKKSILKEKPQTSAVKNYASINSEEPVQVQAHSQSSLSSPQPETSNTSRNNDSRVNFSDEDVTQNIFYNSSFVAQNLATKAAENDEEFLSNKFESLDYDKIYNVIDFKQDNDSKPSKFISRKQLARWVVMLLVGIFTALVAVVIDYLVENVSTFKYSYISKKMTECTTERCLYQPLLIWVFSNVGLASIACGLVVFLAPASRGSGIPMVKCYLNGIKIPEIVRFKTLIAKMFGVAFSVGGGLAVGKEGPMIHSGSIIAAGISQGFSTSLGFDFKIFKYFRSDTEKRDFVSGGAAAGVAAAFGAPVGGVLFSLEEGASFWNQQLTWKIFFGSMISTFTLNVFLGLIRGNFGDLSNPGLINFGKFQDINYKWYELPLFLLMGAIGGLIGALFNYMNVKLTKYRNVYVRSKLGSLMECMIVASMSAIVGFLLSFYIRKDCQPIGRDLVSKYPVQLFCDDGQYNAMSGLIFQTPEKSIKSLFHDPPGSFNPLTLACFCAAYFILACWTYGLAIPSGLFIPSLLIGAAWGRLFGIGVSVLFPGTNVDPGKYALIGAASMLGGILRMTLSLTVIVTEATGNISLGLPIMFAMMAAKLTGDLFNEGIFDMHIQLSGIPLLEWEPPAMTNQLTAQHAMTYPVVVLREKESVGRILDILKRCEHNGFPVVSGYDPNEQMSETFGQLKGLILRHQLLTLLKKKCYLYDRPELTPEDFRESYPRYLSLKEIDVSMSDMDNEIDLRPYMNLSPYSMTESSNLPRMFRLFRGLGLRHLVIVDDSNKVVGIVTRIDLAKYRSHVGFLHASVRELNITT